MTMYGLSFSTVLLVQAVQNYNLRFYVYIPLYAMIQISMYTIGLYSCYYYGFPPASAIVTSAEMARVTMKVHAYFREKIINGVNKDGYYATFIPEWAVKSGITIQDLDQP